MGWQGGGEREREREREQKVSQGSHPFLPMDSNSESQSDLGLDPGALAPNGVIPLGLMPLLVFLFVIPCPV